MSSRIYPLTHRQNAAVILSGIVLAGFSMMWLLVGLNLLAGGGHAQKYLLFGLLSILLYFSWITWRSSCKHRNAAENARLLVMMDGMGMRWLYYDALTAALHDYVEEDNGRFYVQQDMPWKEVLDVRVEHGQSYRTFGKIIVDMKSGEGEKPLRHELLLKYFDDKEIAEEFINEMLYFYTISR